MVRAMTMRNYKVPAGVGAGAGVPILGVVGAKVWRCLNGHEQRGAEGHRMPVAPMSGGAVLMSGPHCPVCFGDWLQREFPVYVVEPEAEAAQNTEG